MDGLRSNLCGRAYGGVCGNRGLIFIKNRSFIGYMGGKVYFCNVLLENIAVVLGVDFLTNEKKASRRE